MFDLQKKRISGPPLPQSPGVCSTCYTRIFHAVS